MDEAGSTYGTLEARELRVSRRWRWQIRREVAPRSNNTCCICTSAQVLLTTPFVSLSLQWHALSSLLSKQQTNIPLPPLLQKEKTTRSLTQQSPIYHLHDALRMRSVTRPEGPPASHEAGEREHTGGPLPEVPL